MQVIIEDNIAIAASSIVDNVIVSNNSLRRYLRCPFRARGLFAAVISATGVRVSLDYGSKNVIAESDLRVGTDLQVPLDVLNDTFFPDSGDQLVIRAANSTGGSINLRYRLILELWDEEFPPDTRVMQRTVSIPSLTVDQQVLSGLRYERSPVNAMLAIFMTASATGLTKQVFVDTTNIIPPSTIPPLNRMPQDPFDLNVDGIEVPNDKLIELAVSNPTGGALTVNWRIKLQEMTRY